MLFKLLYYTIALHHPQGRRQHEEGSLANNWEQWNRSLNSITELICLEVSYMQKSRRQNDRILQKYSYFYDLAASTYYQVEYNHVCLKRPQMCINIMGLTIFIT